MGFGKIIRFEMREASRGVARLSCDRPGWNPAIFTLSRFHESTSDRFESQVVGNRGQPWSSIRRVPLSSQTRVVSAPLRRPSKLDHAESAKIVCQAERDKRDPGKLTRDSLNPAWVDGLDLAVQDGPGGVAHWLSVLKTRQPDQVDAFSQAISGAREKINSRGCGSDDEATSFDAGPEEDGDPFGRTDLGNARRLAHLFGDDIRYCHPMKSWFVWSSDRWQVDNTGQIGRVAEKVVRHLHDEGRSKSDPALYRAMKQWAEASESEARINAMISLGRSRDGIPVLADAFDQHSFLLNCPNGTVDLMTGCLGPHVRSHLHTKRTGSEYDPDAQCPTWDRFLRRILAEDEEMIGFLQRAVGYAATGSVREQVLFFLHGSGGNGKSTFLEAIHEVLGDYAMTVNADLLIAKTNEDHPTGLADLQGNRFAATFEVEDGKRLAEALIKSITGSDRIKARRMRQDFYEFAPTHKLFLAANHRPEVRGTDNGIWRRIKLLPFTVEISEEEKDRSLPEKLRFEAPGILAWIVRGCLEWQRIGLAEPAMVMEATQDYRSEMDALGNFLEECCEQGGELRCPTAELYGVYCKWCTRMGTKPLSSNKLGRRLSDRGFGIDKGHGVAKRTGLRPREDFLPEPWEPKF